VPHGARDCPSEDYSTARPSTMVLGMQKKYVAGHVYTFRTSYSLGAGQRVYLHTGKGTDGRPDAQHRYQNSGNYIWNNTGDTARLQNSLNKVIDFCTYKAVSGRAAVTC